MWRLKNNVCQAILVTSIFWLLLDIIILFYFLTNSTTISKKNNYRQSKFVRNVSFLQDTTFKTQLYETSDELEQLLKELRFDSEGPGQDGEGINVDNNNEEIKKMFEINQFNLFASNVISINRSLPDYRSERCKEKALEYNIKAETSVSIIIVFHNEAFSTLLRTLHSVINRSPHHLITEIILIDDKSERDYLKKPLELYIKRFPIKTHLIHLKERSGLIRARLTGSDLAKGSILLFLDAHVEVTEGWLEPLVERVQFNRKVVVTPIIDVISDDNFEYITASDMTWGGFNWHLNFCWYPVSEREKKRRGSDESLPIRTPTIAGGLFAIDRQFFYDIGSYDEGMEVWGGENLELSFRVWTCGGSLEINMCSRVGHVFRKKTPYTFPGGTATVIYHNARRTAEVWMDNYKQFFYATVPNALKVDEGDLTQRLKLRSMLQCKSFKWYLENIYVEAPIPSKYYSIGQIIHAETKLCLDTYGRKSGEKPGLNVCLEMGGNQAWSLTAAGEIRSDLLCLFSKVTGNNELEVELEKCSVEEKLSNYVFHYNEKTKQIYQNNKCLSVNENNLIFVSCTDDAQNTMWYLENYKNLNE